MWSLPVIQGFVNKIELYINAQKLKLILISRRSINHGGPWQYAAGLSEAGNAANFVETEQIFAINDMLFSFVQVRGSVPIFWSQKFIYGVATGVSLKGSLTENNGAFQLHISNLLKNRQYNNIILLNLLNK
jgi:phosphatidylinositol-bisphosphatase